MQLHWVLWKCMLFCVFAWSLGGLTVVAQLQLFDENGGGLGPIIVVGGAIDVTVQVRCARETGEPGNWAYTNNGSVVPSGLVPFGISQDSGTLRIFPISLLHELPTLFGQFICSGDFAVARLVLFEMAETLFFSEPVPPTTTLPVDQFTCSVPDIPPAQIQIVQPSSDSLYCRVETERGIFRSRGVAVIDSDPVPTFQIQPVNITVGNLDRAAFACSVTPSTDLQMIKWFFMADPGSGSGMNLVYGLMDADVGVTTLLDETDLNVVIVSSMGTSILTIENVEHDRAGYYVCSAIFEDVDATELNSTSAFLCFNDATASDGIILAPPATLTVDEGESVSVPCVTSGSAPQFLFNGATIDQENITPTDYSLDFVSIQRESAGQYVCQFEGINVTFVVEVLVPLQFTLTPENEVAVNPGDTVSLQCSVNGNPPSEPIVWLRNGNPVVGERFSIMSVIMENTVTSTLTIEGVQREDAGFYQCLAQVQGDPSTAIVASTYLNIQSAVNITEQPQSIGPILIGELASFTCTARSIPIPNITWFRFENGDEVQLVENGDNINITEVVLETFTVQSSLLLRVTQVEDSTSYFCVADNTFSNESSEVAMLDINECIGDLDNCDPNAQCTNTPGSFQCQCNPGFEGDGQTCSDDCDTTGAQCVNTPGSFECCCNQGYVGDGQNCFDIDECAGDLDNCDPNAQCTNTPGSFQCQCNPDFEGDGQTCSDASVLFQLRLMGISNCPEWVSVNANAKLEDIVGEVALRLEELCRCGFTEQNIADSGFQCFSDMTEVTVRARLHGTASASSSELVSYIEQWVESGISILVQGVRLAVDDNCQPIVITSFDDPECPTDPDDDDDDDDTEGIIAVTLALAGILFIFLAVTVISWCLIRKCIRKLKAKPLDLEVGRSGGGVDTELYANPHYGTPPLSADDVFVDSNQTNIAYNAISEYMSSEAIYETIPGDTLPHEYRQFKD